MKTPRTQKDNSKAPRSATAPVERAAVVLMGSPGSGKTTLARAMAEYRPISIIEVGNLLKAEVQRRTELARTIKSFTSTGKLVPLPHVLKVVSTALDKTREDIVFFDGIPRSVEQIEPFLKLIAEHDLTLRAVIILTLNLQTALDRLVGRRICSRCGTLYNLKTKSAEAMKTCERCGGELIQRQDDREEVVRARFQRFDDETLPVIEFFKKEFTAVTWEQSATTPMPQRVQRIWRRLEKAIPHLHQVQKKPAVRPHRRRESLAVT